MPISVIRPHFSSRLGVGARLAIAACLMGTIGCGSPGPAPEWVEHGDHRSIELRPSGGNTGFRPVAGSGIEFVGTLSDTAFVANRHRVNGAGVAIGDVDGDGRPDVFLAGLEADSRLYRNLGDWQFEDVTAVAGLDLAGLYNTGAAFVDTDGDSDLDLIVTVLDGPSLLLINDGTGVFTKDLSWPGWTMGPRGGTTIAAADLDGDTDLDVYVTNYKRQTVKDLYHPDQITFEQTVERTGDAFEVLAPFDEHYRVEIQDNRVMRYEYGEPDALMINTGSGFRLGTAESFPFEEAIPSDWGLAAQFRDLDGDGDPDLYVCNDFESADHVWINDGSGKFSRLPTLAIRHTSQSSMAVDGADVDRDGDTDLFITEMLSRSHERRLRQVGNPPPILAKPGEIEVRPQVMHNTLLMARSQAGPNWPLEYAEAARAFDVHASEWSWSALFMDVDLDGWEDLLISTGHRYDAMDMDAQTSMSGRRSGPDWTRELLDFPRLDLPNVAFRNQGGTYFTEVDGGWGIGVEADVTHGMAFGDLDGDGDLDLVTNRLNAVAGVFRNDASGRRIAVRLKGRGSNTHGIGARVVLSSFDEGLPQTREILAGGQYLSGSEAIATFAALEDSSRLHVHWRSGRTIAMTVHANRHYELNEPDGPLPDAPVDLPAPPVYVPTTLTQDHTEAFFEDRARQALLTRRLSQDGPYAATGDLDGDNLPDLVIGAGGGGRPAIYLTGADLSPADVGTYRVTGQDWGGVAVSDGRILAAVSGYESGTTSRLDQYVIEDGALVDRGETDLGSGSAGPVAVADVNGNGAQEVFVGMRFLPDRYPESVPGRLLQRDGESWKLLAELPTGLATGAAFADMDGDGDQDLAVSAEWGAVAVFENDGTGGFTDVSASLGFSGQVGLWRSATWADVDNDGRPDLVTTNWGWNSPWGRVGAPEGGGRGPRLYWGDFDRNGSVDPVEAEYVPTLGDWAPTMKLMDLVRGLRYVTRRVSSAQRYARMTLEEVLGPPIEDAPFVELTQLGHTVWMNRPGGFEARLLPEATQWTPASGVAATDVDGDGSLDLILSQNFFGVLPEDATRQDAGSGQILLGRGDGTFEVSPHALGLYGDGRALVNVDVDGDGVDELLATQNGAPAYLFRLAPELVRRTGR